MAAALHSRHGRSRTARGSGRSSASPPAAQRCRRRRRASGRSGSPRRAAPPVSRPRPRYHDQRGAKPGLAPLRVRGELIADVRTRLTSRAPSAEPQAGPQPPGLPITHLNETLLRDSSDRAGAWPRPLRHPRVALCPCPAGSATPRRHRHEPQARSAASGFRATRAAAVMPTYAPRGSSFRRSSKRGEAHASNARVGRDPVVRRRAIVCGLAPASVSQASVGEPRRRTLAADARRRTRCGRAGARFSSDGAAKA